LVALQLERKRVGRTVSLRVARLDGLPYAFSTVWGRSPWTRQSRL